MKKNDRLQALQILQKLLEEKTPLTHLLQADNDISPLTKAICYGVCRHYFRLQKIADKLVNKRPQTLDVWLVILIGLYQLQFLDKPDYATVKETVDLVDKLKKSWAKGLINAVLRRFGRERDAIINSLASDSDYQAGHPKWFVKRVKKDWPDEWQALLKGNDEHPPMTLRVNQTLIQLDDYVDQLQTAGIEAERSTFSPAGIRLFSPVDVRDLPGFAEGQISVQDEAAQLAVSMLDLQPGLRVLDACCAPGGKTCHILESEPNLAECVALDVDNKRLQRVQENLKRLHLSAKVIQGDALQPDLWWDGQLFDRILLDAPCSATGVIRRHPDIKVLRTDQDVKDITSIQAGMLRSLWPLLKPGGLLVYATCSVIKQENEEQIVAFIAEQAGCKIVDAEQPWGISTGHGRQIMPGQNNCDGFFYSVLHKDG